MKMPMKPWILSLVLVAMPVMASAQEQKVNVSNPTPLVGQEVEVWVDPAPTRDQSSVWTIEAGKAQLLGDTLSPKIKVRPIDTRQIVITCVIHAPDGKESRPQTRLIVSGGGPATATAPPTPTTTTTPVTTQPPAQPAAPHPAARAVELPPNAARGGLLRLEAIDNVMPTGWMGDAMSENGATATLNAGHATNCHSHETCYRVEYRPGKLGWAAFAFQRVPEGTMNWGEYPGVDLSRGGYQSLRVWARADLDASSGTLPKVQFKSGGNVKSNAPNGPASYTVSGAIVELNGWRELCLDLRDRELSNVISPLTVVLTAAANPHNAAVVFDDVAFSTTPCPAPPKSPQ